MTKNINHTAIIFGSSNNLGNTYQLSQQIANALSTPIYNLSDYAISNFDYSHINKDDDFLALVQELIEKYETFMFISPVYWYAMSAIMKTFFDRLSDLLTIEKELGRRLRGKRVIFITSSIGNNLNDDFWIPIKATCNYLEMNFTLGIHYIDDKITDIEIQQIANSI